MDIRHCVKVVAFEHQATVLTCLPAIMRRHSQIQPFCQKGLSCYALITTSPEFHGGGTDSAARSACDGETRQEPAEDLRFWSACTTARLLDNGSATPGPANLWSPARTRQTGNRRAAAP